MKGIEDLGPKQQGIQHKREVIKNLSLQKLENKHARRCSRPVSMCFRDEEANAKSNR